jgi:hypothetical protein
MDIKLAWASSIIRLALTPRMCYILVVLLRGDLP